MSVDSPIDVAFDTRTANMQRFNDKKDQLVWKGIVVTPDRIRHGRKLLLKVHRSNELDEVTAVLNELDIGKDAKQDGGQQSITRDFHHLSRINVRSSDDVATAETRVIFLVLHADQPVAKRRVSAMTRCTYSPQCWHLGQSEVSSQAQEEHEAARKR